MTQDKLTPEDLQMLEYYGRERDDVTEWSEWEQKLPLLRREFPHLVKAVEQYATAKYILSLVIKDICQ